MGTRLYPVAKNAVLDKLAGVEEGSFDALDKVNAAFESLQVPELPRLCPSAALYAMRRGVIEELGLEDADKFQLFGWGKLTIYVWAILEALGTPDCAGQVNDKEIMEDMLISQDVELPEGVSINDIDALCWS
jgi:hypothetical protein